MTLEEYAERFLSQRDRLALRKLRGETLTEQEVEGLAVLNRLLDTLMPPVHGLPQDVLHALEEAEKLLASKR
jgi:hypothetical protein